MDYRLPLTPDDTHLHCTPRRPHAAWLLITLIGVVLGAASLAAASVTDTRDFAARHGAVLATRAL
jgi:hypothetical protein